MHSAITTFRAWLAGHGAELRLTLRIVVAALATFVLAETLRLPQPFWAVITACIVMQASVGGSLKASLDRLIGTVAGAVYGGAVAILLSPVNLISDAIALVVAIAPLALLAALYPTFRIAPVTAVIVLLTPAAAAVSPVAFTIDRIVEIGLGCIVGLAVSLVVFPARAHGLAADGAGRTLALLAELLPVALAGLAAPLDMPRVLQLQARIRTSLAQLESLTGEARGERAGHLTDEPDPGPLLRTAMRLRHDVVSLIRAADAPMPEAIHRRLAPPLARIEATGTALLQATGAALVTRGAAPDLAPYSDALSAYNAGIAVLRRDGLTRDLSAETVGRLFAVGFALEQLRQDLGDMAQRAAEFALPPTAATT